ncbi:MAG: hypothetical protein Q9190_007863 [Brigantiaea leucoxantha]
MSNRLPGIEGPENGISLRGSYSIEIESIESFEYYLGSISNELELEEEKDIDYEDDIIDLQAGYSSRTAGFLLGFTSSTEEFDRFELEDPSFERDFDQARLTRFNRLKSLNLEFKLRELLGEKAGFRGFQKEVLRAIVARESPILTVAPTVEPESLEFPRRFSTVESLPIRLG